MVLNLLLKGGASDPTFICGGRNYTVYCNMMIKLLCNTLWGPKLRKIRCKAWWTVSSGHYRHLLLWAGAAAAAAARGGGWEWGGRRSNYVLFWPKYVLPGPTDLILWLGIPGTSQNDCCILLFWCCRLMKTGVLPSWGGGWGRLNVDRSCQNSHGLL